MLYGRGIPEFDDAIEGLRWFLSCGAEPGINGEAQQNEEYFSFDEDKERLFSAFMVKYGINLNKADNLHFFEFIALMNDLNKTAFRNVVDLRMMKPKDMKNYSREQKQEILELKKKFAIKKVLEKQYTEEQKRAIDHFDKLVGLEYLRHVHIKTASKINAKVITERQIISSLSYQIKTLRKRLMRREKMFNLIAAFVKVKHHIPKAFFFGGTTGISPCLITVA